MDGKILLLLSKKEVLILAQALGNRKKVLRGKIKNNENHLKKMDMPSWTEKDFDTAIKKRKIQLAETDILKTLVENVKPHVSQVWVEVQN